jgi:hypothetical protein
MGSEEEFEDGDRIITTVITHLPYSPNTGNIAVLRSILDPMFLLDCLLNLSETIF